MKKFFALALCSVLALSLVGCKPNEPKPGYQIAKERFVKFFEPDSEINVRKRIYEVCIDGVIYITNDTRYNFSAKWSKEGKIVTCDE